MDGEWAVKEREERRKGGIEKGEREEGRLGRSVRFEGTKKERMGQLMKSNNRAHQILVEPADTEGRL